jgi:hypothetical protein
MLAFFGIYAWRIVGWDVTMSFLVPDEFLAELQVLAFHYDSFIHFRGGNYAI